jgi:hypothetical protein
MRLERNAGWTDGCTCSFAVFKTVDVPKYSLLKTLGKWLGFNDTASNFTFPLRRILEAQGLFLCGGRGYYRESRNGPKEKALREFSHDSLCTGKGSEFLTRESLQYSPNIGKSWRESGKSDTARNSVAEPWQGGMRATTS